MNRSQRLRSVLATVLMAACVAGAWGQQTAPHSVEKVVPSSQKVSFDIASQPVADALTALAQQSGLTIMLASGVNGDVVTPALRGEYTAEEALTRMLGPTGLRAEYLDAKTVKVSMPDGGSAGSKKRDSKDNNGSQNSDKQKQDTQSAPATSTSESLAGSTEALERPKAKIPEILISGSRSLDADIERTENDIQPYVVIGRKEIEESGAASVDDLFRTHLPMSYVPLSNAQQASLTGSSSTIALRGLGSAQTLILIDGRPASSIGLLRGSSQPDLNGIPLSAIERIEVLPATASGIYGGGATGGVVNIIMRRDYSGIEGTAEYRGTADGGGSTRRLDVNSGFTSADGSTSVLVSGSYAKTDILFAGSRPYVSDRYTSAINSIVRSSGGVLPYPPLGRTTNICTDAGDGSCSSAPLVLNSGQQLNSSYTFVPSRYPGVASDGGAALAANSGRFNLSLANTAQLGGGASSSLLNNPTVGSLSMSARRKLTSILDVFVDLSGTKTESSFTENQLGTTFEIPQGAPNNPFTQGIVVTTPALGADSAVSVDNRSVRALVGMIAKFPNDWRAEFDFTHTRVDIGASVPGIALDDATNTAISDGTIDVIRDTNISPQLDLGPDVIYGQQVSPTHSILDDETIRAGGQLWNLPAGKPSLTMLLEHKVQSISSSSQTTYVPDTPPSVNYFTGDTQTIDSAYIELNAPLVSEAFQIPGLYKADIQLAGRFDRYREVAQRQLQARVASIPTGVDDFSSINPTFGIRIQPTRDVAIRASAATGFLPPDPSQLQPGLSTLYSPAFNALFGLKDPLRGGAPLASVLVKSGGNPALDPEKSRSVEAGMIVTPHAIPDFRASIDWTKITKHENVGMIFYNQQGIDQELQVPGLVTRSQPVPGDPYSVGPITQFDASLRNLALTKIQAFDLTLDYTFRPVQVGDVRVTGAATREVHNAQQASSFALPIEYAGTYQTPGWAANMTVSLSRSRWSVAWTARYLDSYWINLTHAVDPVQGSARVPSGVYHDVYARYQFEGGSSTSVLSDLEIRAGVEDLFNKPPRFYSQGEYYADPWSSPLMATYFVSIRKAFH